MKIIATMEWPVETAPMSDIPALCREIRVALALVKPDAKITCEIDDEES